MNMSNVTTSPEVARKANLVVAELKEQKSANVSGIREEIEGFNEEVFYQVKETLDNEGVDYGSSRSDGRFWLND